MDVFVVFSVVAGVGFLAVVRRFLLYPCRPSAWEYAFGSAYGKQRRALDAARRAKRRIEGSHREEAARAERRVDEISERGDRRRRELEKRRDDLLRERDGAALEPAVGRLWLHERVVLVLKETGEAEDGAAERGGPAEVEATLPLAGLVIDPYALQDNIFIRFSRPDGTRLSATFPRQRYKEADVHAFADRLHNQARKETAAHARRRQEADGITREIERTRADTEEKVLAARETHEELVEAQREDERLLRADAAWEAACAEWRATTGHRPVWWWRW
ncbi:hypothetical protein ACFU3J_20760 [Streptomyces sp. NPDC057411]|uniref:hypothetical protein n=1 Tax=unclassified Streptomyces TaxID=2593676 RepID=UPI00362E5705